MASGPSGGSFISRIPSFQPRSTLAEDAADGSLSLSPVSAAAMAASSLFDGENTPPQGPNGGGGPPRTASLPSPMAAKPPIFGASGFPMSPLHERASPAGDAPAAGTHRPLLARVNSAPVGNALAVSAAGAASALPTWQEATPPRRTAAAMAATPSPRLAAPQSAASPYVEDAHDDDSIQVIVRVRPMNGREQDLYAAPCVAVAVGPGGAGSAAIGRTLTLTGGHAGDASQTQFTFDHVAGEGVSQEGIFRLVGRPIVRNCLAGYNSSIFAYGQTGSGKTYTMLGDLEAEAAAAGAAAKRAPSTNRGLVPRVFEHLFSRMTLEEGRDAASAGRSVKFLCKVSFLEIYNESITDLLDPGRTNLQIREDIKSGVFVENLSEEAVFSVEDVARLLLKGVENRRVGETAMNSESSRSHSVFTCLVESKATTASGAIHIRHSRLNLVDLAGSERAKASGAVGDRLREASGINKSLSALGHVIMSLADMAAGKQRHVPYRDSRLTFLLQDSLGGNAKTVMLAAVSPASVCASETLSTLRFAQRAKSIRNKAVVNEDTSGDAAALKEQIRALKSQLAAAHAAAHGPPAGLRSAAPTPMRGYAAATPGAARAGSRTTAVELASLEAALTGALRREGAAVAETARRAEEAAGLQRLLKQREADAQGLKMVIRFRDDKIRRLELASDGGCFRSEEEEELRHEISLLRASVEHHPEVTRFGVENLRLAGEIKHWQTFYEGGERAALLSEVDTLRERLAATLEGKAAAQAEAADLRAAAERLGLSLVSGEQEEGSLAGAVATGGIAAHMMELRRAAAEEARRATEAALALAAAQTAITRHEARASELLRETGRLESELLALRAAQADNQDAGAALEASAAIWEAENAAAAASAAEAAAEAAQRALAEQEEAARAWEAEAGAQREARAALERELLEARAAAEEKERDLDDARQAASAAAACAQAAAERVNGLEAERAALVAAAADAQLEAAAAEAEASTLRGQLASANETLGEELYLADEEISGLRDGLAARFVERAALHQRAEAAEGQLAAAQAELEHGEARVGAAVAECCERREAMEELRDLLAAAQAAAAQSAARAEQLQREAQLQLEAARAEAEGAAAREAALEVTAAVSVEQMAALQAALASMEAARAQDDADLIGLRVASEGRAVELAEERAAAATAREALTVAERRAAAAEAAADSARVERESALEMALAATAAAEARSAAAAADAADAAAAEVALRSQLEEVKAQADEATQAAAEGELIAMRAGEVAVVAEAAAEALRVQLAEAEAAAEEARMALRESSRRSEAAREARMSELIAEQAAAADRHAAALEQAYAQVAAVQTQHEQALKALAQAQEAAAAQAVAASAEAARLSALVEAAERQGAEEAEALRAAAAAAAEEARAALQAEVAVKCVDVEIARKEAAAALAAAQAQWAAQESELTAELTRLRAELAATAAGRYVDTEAGVAQLSAAQAVAERLMAERETWLDEVAEQRAAAGAATDMADRLRLEAESLREETAGLRAASALAEARVAELERELAKLAGQHNLNQRIQHHVRIKEENNKLKVELNCLQDKLEKQATYHARCEEDLAKYRAAAGRPELLDIDEEERLRKMLRSLEAERAAAARELASLTQAVLSLEAVEARQAAEAGDNNAAGAEALSADLATEATPTAAAGHAIKQLTARLIAGRRALADARFRCRRLEEGHRLAEMRQAVGGMSPAPRVAPVVCEAPLSSPDAEVAEAAEPPALAPPAAEEVEVIIVEEDEDEHGDENMPLQPMHPNGSEPGRGARRAKTGKATAEAPADAPVRRSTRASKAKA